jgi:hypothetical protein
MRRALTGDEVRGAVFARTGRGRRGLVPQQVRAFITYIAVELDGREEREAALRRDNALLLRENEALKDALRQWQSRHGRPDPNGNTQAGTGQRPNPPARPGPVGYGTHHRAPAGERP